MPTTDHEERPEGLEFKLLEQIRRQAAALNLPRLVEWLAEVLDGHVALINYDGFPLATSSPAAHAMLAPAEREIPRVAAGELQSAALDDGASQVRLRSIGSEAPHVVLATARKRPYPPRTADAVSHIADVLALLLPIAKIEHEWSRVREAATDAQVAILQLLMTGQATLAGRAAASIAPGALAHTVRVYIVDCSAEDRSCTAEAIGEAISRTSPPRGVTKPRTGAALADGALMAPCPAYDSHLIVVAPTQDVGDPTQGEGSVHATLHSVVADRDDLYLGVSEPAALPHTADAYRDAWRALGIAQHVPERTCVCDRFSWPHFGHDRHSFWPHPRRRASSGPRNGTAASSCVFVCDALPGRARHSNVWWGQLPCRGGAQFTCHKQTWQYNGDAQITAVIDPEQAHHWAETFLQPLITAPHVERDYLFTTVRHALAFPTTEVAKILDVHRNTVTGRVNRVADLLQLDLSDIRACAVLNLALQIDADAVALHHSDPHPGEANLEDILASSSATAWAEMTLAPLNRQGRKLRRTLRAWTAHNADANCVAAELGIHPQTVRGHLRSVERLLQRPLLAGASGAHDVVLAQFIAGDMPTSSGTCRHSHHALFDPFRPHE